MWATTASTGPAAGAAASRTRSSSTTTTIGDNGIEADNNSDDNDLEPRAKPTITSVTLIGGQDSSDKPTSDIGMLLREGTAGALSKIMVVGFGEACGDVDQAATYANAWNDTDSEPLNGELTVTDSVFYCPGVTDDNGDPVDRVPADDDDGSEFTVEDFFTTLNTGNTVVDTNPLSDDAFNPTAPDFSPAGTETAGGVTGDDWTSGLDFLPGELSQGLGLNLRSIWAGVHHPRLPAPGGSRVAAFHGARAAPDLSPRGDPLGDPMFRPLLMTLALPLAAAPAWAADDGAAFAQQLSDLRTEVEELSETLELEREALRADLRQRELRKAELEARIRQEELRLKELERLVAKQREILDADTVADETLTPVLLAAIEDVKAVVRSGLPYRVEARLGALDDLADKIQGGTPRPAPRRRSAVAGPGGRAPPRTRERARPPDAHPGGG